MQPYPFIPIAYYMPLLFAVVNVFHRIIFDFEEGNVGYFG